MRRQDPEEFGKAIQSCAEDALKRMTVLAEITYPNENGHLYKILLEDITIYMFTQGWSDGGCGFGPGGQALTSARTIVFIDEYWSMGGAVVYHDYRFAGHVIAPNEKFWEHLQKQKIRGARDDWSIYERHREA